jgi:hypothetical protein
MITNKLILCKYLSPTLHWYNMPFRAEEKDVKQISAWNLKKYNKKNTVY